ncbi:MAG TPA: PAS domain S-box protein [Bacteroidia bacterium]|jgi:PAS domain S-box-containing protein|nr:PAS domain S-box protein [Bacteroidia bacterium]
MIEVSQKFTELTFQLIVESSPNAIVLVNKEGKIAYVNNQTEKLFGYTRSELIGRKVEQLIPERFSRRHPDFVKMFFLEPSVRAMGAGRELFALRKDKTEFPIEIGLNPVVTVDGTLVLASIIDITERKKAEQRFQLVVESAPNAMVLVNSAGSIALVNHQVEVLFGYQRSELIGNKIEMLIPERFRNHHPEHRSGFFQKPQTRAMGIGRDLFGLKKDGTEVQIEIGLNPIETLEGHMVLASIIDITERKVKEQMAKRQIELETKNEELEHFTYIASHDLQAPLRTVLNYIQVFEEEYMTKLDENAHMYLDRMKLATERMGALIKALLDFSRIGRDVRLNRCDLKKIVEDVVADIDTLIKESQAIVEIGELPVLNVYEVEMRQLFQNLISNAIKFSKKNIPPRIKIFAEPLTDQWKFYVEDNGIGIAENHYKRIFYIFQRLNITNQYEGYGIGLANCKKIVELHNGEITVYSELGKGSTFSFTISTTMQ